MGAETRFLVDTNVLSELMRPRPDPRVASWMANLHHIAVSVITVEEIVYGLTLKPNARVERWFDDFVAKHCDVLPVTKDISAWCGRVRAQLRMAGKTRTQADILIASTAAREGLRLATRNTRDFEGCGVPLFDPFDPYQGAR